MATSPRETRSHCEQAVETKETRHLAVRTLRAAVSCLTSVTLVLAPACGDDAAGGQLDDIGDTVPRVGTDVAAIFSEVAELRAQPVVLAPTAQVGALPAEAGVDAGGEAHYSIPIEVSPGVRGMQPTLSVSYGSNSGDGGFGDRFSLTGLSGITRCAKTLLDDGAWGPVTFENDDALCLDGDRLVLFAGEHGQAGAEYRTKRNPFARIVLDHDVSFLGGTFTVWSRDGRILTYGTTAASLWKGVTGGSEIPWRWSLHRQCDRFDNCIDYEYTHGDDAPTGPTELRLMAIRYGGTGPAASRRAVELSWHDRSDTNAGWFFGVELRRKKVVDTITVSGPYGEVVRKYEFDYQQDEFSGLTQMQKARLCDASDVCLPDTTFEWSGNSGAGFELEEWDNVNAFDSTIPAEQAALLQSRHTLVGDFDGNGASELLFRKSTDDNPWIMWFGDAEEGGAATYVDLPPFESMVPYGNESVESLLDNSIGDPLADLFLETDLHRFQPEFSGAVINFQGGIVDDILIPLRGGYPSGAGGFDASLHSYAEGFAIGINAGVGVFSTYFPEAPAGEPIYQMVPTDHDADSFTDIWLCRGSSYKDAEWVLAHHLGGGVPELGFEYLSTGIACSAHDELSMASVDGGPPSLLVIPAYEEPGGDLLATEDRVAYQRLSMDLATGDAELLSTGLPRDTYQRTHDLHCRNGLAISTYGGPIFGAGMGYDKHLDLNEDGFEDVLRFELAAGDGIAQMPMIGDGLEYTDWGDGILCGSDDELEYPAVIVPYYNTGAGYVRGSPALELDGNAHANFWLNFVGAQILDVNDDAHPDLLMPASGPNTDWTVVGTLSDGTFTSANVRLPDEWPAYGPEDDDDEYDWRDELDELLGVRIYGIDSSPGWRPDLAFVGIVEGNAAAWPTAVNIYKMDGGDSYGRMERATDGLGAVSEFEYGAIYAPDPQIDWPMAPMRASLWVTKAYERTAANGGLRRVEYEYENAVVDRRGGGSLGFGAVTSNDGKDRVRTEYLQEYDEDAQGYPLRGMPSERVRYTTVSGALGQETEHVEREVWDWETRVLPIAGGTTFFAYPSSHREQGYLFGAEACEPDLCLGYDDDAAYRDQTTTEVRDDFGVLTSSIETVLAGTAGVLATTRVTQDGIVHDEDAWLLGQVNHLTVESCRSEDCGKRETRTTFYPASGAVASTTVQPGDPLLELESTYTYEAHGNLKRVEQTDPAGETRVTTTEWDTEGALPLFSMNAAGQFSFVVHHSASGALVASVDPAGLTEIVGYDGVFRTVHTSLHSSPMGGDDGAATSIVYAAAALPVDVPDEFEGASAVMSVESTTVNGQRTTDYLGAVGQTLERRWYGMAAVPTGVPEMIPVGGDVFQRFAYDSRDNQVGTSVPQWIGMEPAGFHVRSVDLLGRTISVKAPDGVELERTIYLHDGYYDRSTVRTLTTKDGATLQREVQVAADGVVMQEVDEIGTVNCFTHGAFAQIMTTQRNCGKASLSPKSSTYYDALGHPTLQQDPSLGARTAKWNAFGELAVHNDGAGVETSYDYDALGRVLTRTDPTGKTEYHWDEERLGTLTRSSSPDGIGKDYDYDEFGRRFRETTRVLTASGVDDYVMESTYGPGGRLETLRYPTPDLEPAFVAEYRYDDAGYLRAVVDEGSNALHWIVRTADPSAQPTTESYGNGVQTQRAYDSQRLWVEAIMSTGGPVAQHLSYTWSPEGELQRRDDIQNGQYEEFGYDNLWRLTSSRVKNATGEATRSVTYDVLGNVLSMTGVGAYAYDTAGRITQADGRNILHTGAGNIKAHGSKTLTWTPFDKVRSITSGTNSLTFLYDADGERVSRHESSGDTVTLGSLYERKVTSGGGTVSIVHRVPAEGRIVSQVRSTPNGLGWSTAVLYMHDDALGSTNLVSSSSAGAITEYAALSHDAWGRARLEDNWLSWATTATTAKPGIGFTGHRAELDLGLIDMGGRVYDPTIARFFSGDPLVSDPYRGQAYNRYSYVGNRPLRFTDPSGWAAEPGQDGGAEFQDEGESYYQWAIDWADSQAARHNGIVGQFYYQVNSNPIFAEDFLSPEAQEFGEEAFRIYWTYGPGAVERVLRFMAMEAVQRIEDAVVIAAAIEADPAKFGINFATELGKEIWKDVLTVRYAHGKIADAIRRGEWREAIGIWRDAAEAAFKLAAIVYAAAGMAVRMAKGLKGLSQAVETLKQSQSRRPSAATRRQVDQDATGPDGKMRCAYCGQTITPKSGSPHSREYDHVTPYSRGGGPGPDNIKGACRTCNRQKGAKTLDEWLGPLSIWWEAEE